MTARGPQAAAARDRVALERLPGIPALVRGFVSGDPVAARFLPDRPELAAVAERARAVLASFRPRSSSPKDARLTALASGRAAGIFTGQQVGLFTGPLLTLVKALAAAKLAEELRGAGARAQAAFWCAAEDHDLVEVTRFAVSTASGLEELGPEPGPLQRNRRPVGALPIEVDVEGLLARAADAAGGPAAPPELQELLARSKGLTYLEAFGKTLSWLLGDMQLPLVDASCTADKPDLVPLARRLVRERASVKRLLEERASALQSAGYSLQVTQEPAALPLFAIVGGERWLLREVGARLELRGHPDAGTLDAEEVVERFERGEWLPSFAALTRPLAVSTLYPVAASILGPAELAYWAQSYPLFAWSGIVPPVLVPRPMVALVEPSIRRLMEKLELSVEDALAGPDEILRRRGAGAARALLGRLSKLREEALAGLGELGPELLALDATLDRPAASTREKVQFAFEKLEERVAAAAGRADETLARQVHRVASALCPGGRLAERVLTPVPFLLRLGREGMVGPLAERLRWDLPGLQVIEP